MITCLRLVTFDVTDTLLKFRLAPGRQYEEIATMYGISCDGKSLSRNFKTHWYKLKKEHPNFGLHSGLGWENWWKMIVRGTFKDSNSNIDERKLDAVASHLIEIYKTSMCWQQCHGVSQLLSYLRSRSIPVGIISNFDPRLSTTLVNTRLRHYFQFVITSYEAGVEKPNQKIFQEAMKVSKLKNLKPDECLHVGDNIVLDYLGAQNSGWHGIIIKNKHSELVKETNQNIEPNHVFPDLYHLQKYFIVNSKENLFAHSLH